MKVEFHRADDEEKLAVATATWDGRDVTIQAEDDALRETLARSFRRTPVLVADDSSLRQQGTHGEVVVNPGDLEWFRVVAQIRATAEAGVVARFVPGVTEGGFDPASGYRSFDEQIERLDARTRD